LTLLTYVATPAQAPALVPWLEDPDRDRQRAALLALSHAGALPTGADLTRIGRDDPALAGTVSYAAGMSGHPILEVWAKDDAATSRWRTTARWWQSTGSAVRD
jgi:HrpA-like RNA helicase